MAKLERKSTGKSDKISCDPGVNFGNSFVERSIFDQVHVNMIGLYFKTNKPLNYSRVT